MRSCKRTKDLITYQYVEKIAPGVKVMLVPNNKPFILQHSRHRFQPGAYAGSTISPTVTPAGQFPLWARRRLSPRQRVTPTPGR